MDSTKTASIKKALLLVSIFFLFYTIYHAINTTLFLYSFIPSFGQLPESFQLPDSFNSSSFPWTLVLIQEFAGSTGIYLRVFGGIFAVSSTYLFNKNDSRYLGRLSNAVLFESLYFGLFIPSGINHIILSFSEFTFAGFNLYTGTSFLLQGLILFPVLLLFSQKIKANNYISTLKWIGITAPLYVFTMWIKHSFFWIFALSQFGSQSSSLFETIGAINSLLTLLIASLVSLFACLPIIQKRNKINFRLVGIALILVGAYFAIYLIVMFWVPVYLSFFGLTEFWMISLLIPGLATFLKIKD
ncbi:MAG: hypothetical protein AC479_08470 [miscellaneous Crenarchaeota group-6 archaeon AD8-1]|nr:MAG: hypothetical protein AC479_08470 [miscellaneous Crenarchaeota group-6 archaeon AD8-1]